MEICVEWNGWSECNACCGPCSSCSNMMPVSTTPPHDENNCESRAAGICNGSIQNPGGLDPFYSNSNLTKNINGCSHDGDCSKGQECVNGECVGDPGMSIDIKRMQKLANIINKNKNNNIGMKNRELKNIIRKALQEQGGGPIPRYRIDAGGCLQCSAGAGPNNCPYLDKECTVHYSDNYSGGVGHPGEDDPNMSGGSTSQSGTDTGGIGGTSSWACKNNFCVKVIGKGGVGDFTTEDECLESGCGERARPTGGSKGRNRKALAVNELIKNIKKMLNK